MYMENQTHVFKISYFYTEITIRQNTTTNSIRLRLSAGTSLSKSTQINFSSSAYLTPQGMWAILTLQLSTKSHMQKCWREQWPREAHRMLQTCMDASVMLLPQKIASTTVMEAAVKHTQVAEINLSTAICTSTNCCNHIFVETWKIGLEGTSRGPSLLPCPTYTPLKSPPAKEVFETKCFIPDLNPK